MRTVNKRRYFIRKLLNAVLTIVLVASFNFALFRILPGDPARLLLPKGKTDPAVIERQRKTFNLDKPMWQQFVFYWRDTIRGEFGMSFAEKRPVERGVPEPEVARPQERFRFAVCGQLEAADKL